jgi:hypothetical protein
MASVPSAPIGVAFKMVAVSGSWPPTLTVILGSIRDTSRGAIPEVDRSSVLVAVWDGQPARGLGGTADVVAYARQRGVPMEVIWPRGATRDA